MASIKQIGLLLFGAASLVVGDGIHLRHLGSAHKRAHNHARSPLLPRDDTTTTASAELPTSSAISSPSVAVLTVVESRVAVEMIVVDQHGNTISKNVSYPATTKRRHSKTKTTASIGTGGFSSTDLSGAVYTNSTRALVISTSTSSSTTSSSIISATSTSDIITPSSIFSTTSTSIEVPPPSTPETTPTSSSVAVAAEAPAPAPAPAPATSIPVVAPIMIPAPVERLPAPIIAAASSSNGRGSSKQGCIYNNIDACSILQAINPSAPFRWTSNWANTPQGANVENFAPMLWSSASTFTNTWRNAVTQAKPAAVSYNAYQFLNEPDHPGQANMSPAQAVAAWQAVASQFAGMPLMSPAVTSNIGPNGDYTGLTWLQQYANGLGGANWDYTCIHFYGDCTNVEAQFPYLDNMISQAHKFFGKPVRITEMGCNDLTNTAQYIPMMNYFIPRLESNSAVDGYAFFMADYLVNGNSANPQGAHYMNM